MKLEWGEGDEAVISALEDLDETLDRLAAEAERSEPFIAELDSGGHGSVSIGLGRSQSVLSYVPASLDPPYFASVGGRAHGKTIVFLYRGDWSEFPQRNAIPIDRAREAIRRFFTNPDELPANVAWEEV